MAQFNRPNFDGVRYSNPDAFNETYGSKALFDWSNKSEVPGKQLLDEILPVRKPVFKLMSKLALTWLGHSTAFVRLDGISLITDPVWSTSAPANRYRPPPCSIESVPKLDFGLISHNHPDHLEPQAIAELSARSPNMTWFVPKGVKEYLPTSACGGPIVREMSWGEHATVERNGSKYEVWCIPAMHWSQCRLFDRNKSLWCGWAVVGPAHKFYYSGDTGFCEAEFQKLGSTLGPFDLCAIPIGRYAMKGVKKLLFSGLPTPPLAVGPAEAVKIHRLVGSKKSIGVHWGTYEMGADEHYLAPMEGLRAEVTSAGLPPQEFTTLDHGATWSIIENQ